MVMKVHLEPAGVFSPAMVRIARALSTHHPSHVKIVNDRRDADLLILYVIGLDAVEFVSHLPPTQKVAVIQCCLYPGAPTYHQWHPLWRRASLVMSYYNLLTNSQDVGFRFYHSPLGLDPAFANSIEGGDTGGSGTGSPRLPLVITCGRVSGPGCEAIEEVWQAAHIAQHRVIHLGPPDIQGIRDPTTRYPHVSFTQPHDKALANLYLSARWVAALRHVEGFELPAIEGLVCGARPILFDQPDLRYWHTGSSIAFVPDVTGEPLVATLAALFATGYNPVTTHERYRARARFDWVSICAGFWSHVAMSERDGTGPPPAQYGSRMGKGKRRVLVPQYNDDEVFI